MLRECDMSKKIIVISASTRKRSESLRVGKYITTEIEKNFPQLTTQTIDLSETKVPEISDELLSDIDHNDSWKEISKFLTQAAGFIFVVPEWHGMVPPSLLNLLFLCNDFEVSHKPALIVSISSGAGGTYPIVQLRLSGFKNNRICFLPEHLIIHNVNNFLHDVKEMTERDFNIRKRIHYCLEVFNEYVKALSIIRSSTVNLKQYAYGL